MQFTLEKLKAGMEVASLTDAQQKIVINQWNRLLPYLEAYFPKVMACWPKRPKNGQDIKLPEELSVADNSLLVIMTYCFMADLSRERYLSLGYSEELWRRSMVDLTWHLHNQPDGSLWMDTADNEFGWHISILNADNILLGRLQFYPCTCPEEHLELGIHQGEPMLGFHIPAKGPLDIQACIDSFKQAQAFYAKYMPQVNFKGFYCRSWFLNPVYQKYLPSTSNIVRFQKLGKAYLYPNESRDGLRRVFDFRGVDRNAPNPPTLLQRILQKMVKEGESVANGAIVIPKFM